MTGWREFWNEYPTGIDEEDFLAQVCHTEGGQAYRPEVFDAMVNSILRGLALEERHSLLDLCCGNGVVTRRLAAHCTRTLGIDFSIPLLQVASRHQTAGNLDYLHSDVLDLAERALPGPFDRICLFGALQHFEEDQIDRLFAGIKSHAAKDVVVLIGAVPDAACKHLFFDTPKKLDLHRRYRREGRDRMGTWWDRALLAAAAARAGFACTFDRESLDRPGGHYRFDLQLTTVKR